MLDPFFLQLYSEIKLYIFSLRYSLRYKRDYCTMKNVFPGAELTIVDDGEKDGSFQILDPSRVQVKFTKRVGKWVETYS
jgi:hypothetical protein